MAYKYYCTDYTHNDGGRTVSVSEIETDTNGVETLYIYVERPSKTGKGFDFVQQKLPARVWTKAFGFSEDELFELQRFLLNNEVTFWEIARGFYES